MPNHSFIWYELLAREPAPAIAFYEQVVGWHAHSFDGAEADYTLFDAPDGQGVAGVATLPEGAPAGWFGYIGVGDVDATVARAQAAGAKVSVPPTDIPNVGRFAMLEDRQGIAFYVMRGDSPDPSPDAIGAFAPHAPGHGGWHELHTTDWEDAWDFYHGLFGWSAGRQMDMGPTGKYQIFQIDGVDAGAMFNSPTPAPAWLYYFNVADLDGAAGRVTAQGGTVLNGPMDVPDDQRIVQCQDPHGTSFALVGPGAGA